MADSPARIKTSFGNYEGSIVDGKMCGQGTFVWEDNKKYVGDF